MRFITFILFLLISFAHSPPPNARTTKNKDLFTFNGYEMRKKELINTQMTQVWVCVKRSCAGRAHSAVGTTNLREVTAHNHLPNYDKTIVRQRVEQAKEVAQTNQNLMPREIIGQMRSNLDDSALLQLPSYSAAQRAIIRQREIPGAIGIDRKDLPNIVLEGEFTLDNSGNRFLLYDSRRDEPAEAVFFIFVTDRGLERLRKYRKWSADGTFKVTPPNFLQLYTVNTLVEHVAIPAAYILMANRRSNTYGRAFTVLKNHLGNSLPASLLTDFEESAKNGFRQAFGNEIPVKHCLFHLGQSVLRKVRKIGLTNVYGQNEDFRKAIRSLPALAFLRENEVNEAFRVLKLIAPIEAEPIYEYFQTTYIFRFENGEERPALFRPSRWNQHNSVILDEQRTNNGVEGWHNSFRKRFTSPHPAFSKFIIAIKNEEEHQQNRLRPYEIDPTRGIAERPRLKKYLRNDEAIRRLVIDFDHKENKNQADIINHIHALQYRLGMKGFEEWD